MKKAGFFFILVWITQSIAFGGPGDPVGKLRQQLELFNKIYKRAKLDLLFNQPKYAPGDTAYVRALYLSAQDLKPVGGREIVYLDIFDTQGTRLSHYQIRMNNGVASNAIILPEKAEPGIYLLVAYSDWMRNLDPTLFYRQSFIITGKEQLKEVSHFSNASLHFFPEGGNFVASIENNLVMQFTGSGKATVTINGGGEQWGPVSLDGQGLAEIKMVPQADQVYTATVQAGSKARKFTLPAVAATGMSIRYAKGSTLGISATGLSANANLSLALVGNGGVLWSRPLDVSAGANITLPADLPEGVVQALVIDDNLKIHARRLLMIPSRTTYQVSIKPSRNGYGTRETGQLEVGVMDGAGNPVQGALTVRIINQDLFQDSTSTASVGQNLLLYSDLAGGDTYPPKQDLESVNRYLVTQQSPWVDKALELSGKEKIEYQPLANMAITGRAVFVESGQPVPDSTSIWFFLQKQIFGYQVTTQKKGEFHCPILFDFEGTDEVFYAATRKGADLPGITFQWGKQDSVYGFSARPYEKLPVEDAFGLYRVQKGVIDKSFSYFSKKRIKPDSLVNPNGSIEDELQGADLTLNVQDYILFPTMVDLVREVLRSVDYRKVRGRDVIRVYTSNKAPSNNAGPLYVIDGVMTKNPATFLNLKPKEVFTIKIIKQSNKLVRFGALGANGVILIHTKNAGRDTRMQKDDTFLLTGMSPRLKSATASVPGIGDPARPIMKPCLLWAPHVLLDASGKAVVRFNTSDDVGKFKIEVEGMTAQGKPFFAEETIRVQYNP